MLKMRKREFSGSVSQEISERERGHQELACQIAEEGVVLLKNDGILPLDIKKPVGLFGSGAGCTIKGGTGSGDVNVRNTVSIYQGMKQEGFQISSIRWLDDFELQYQSARLKWKEQILNLVKEAGTEKFFDLYVANPFEMPQSEEIQPGDLKGTDTAIYVIRRNAGEGEDRAVREGDYYLTEEEKNDLKILSELCKNIIVLINSGAQIDLEYIEAFDEVKAILYLSQPGMEGGRAVAGILAGRVTPSGKLTDTWAVSYYDYPNAEQFSYLNGDSTTEFYSEGIYVGYRYFDARGTQVRYPFGYGLSYTDFKISAEQISVAGTKTSVAVKVENVGSKFAGKETVQLYLSCPQGEKKEVKKLVAYAKTKALAPGEAQIIELHFDQKMYAYFCEAELCWKIEAGEYIILMGNSSASVNPIGVVTVDNDHSIERVHEICPLQTELEEWQPDAKKILEQRQIWLNEAKTSEIYRTVWTPQAEHSRRYENKYEKQAAELVEKLTDEQLVKMSLGEVSKGHDMAFGAAGIMVPGAAGETSGCLELEYEVPGVSMADGPAGLRIMKEYSADVENGNVYTQGILGSVENGLFLEKQNDELSGRTTFYQYCTAFPVGTMVAQTWNETLQESFGRAVGTEMQEMGISWWLAPGMNIHRNPLCGRNFEYFSEDPIVSGKTAAAITRGVQETPGVGTTIKHFACNNAEHNRMRSNSIISQRALRELYLRGFEIAVKTAQPMAVMSSYNLVNGEHTAECYDLLTKVLRDEWGFAGIVMTDWSTTTLGGSTPWKVMEAGSNLIMPGAQSDIDNLLEALKNGKLSREVLKTCIKQLLNSIYQTNAYENSCSYQEQFQ